MKLPILLGTLLLSASPVVADDFVYLMCERKGFNEMTDLKTNEIERSIVGSHVQHWKVNVANSRFISDEGDVWDKAKIVNGVAIEEWEKPRNKDGITLSLKSSIQIVPPGPLFFYSLSRSDFYTYSMNGTGMCKGSDASVFEKAMNQPN